MSDMESLASKACTKCKEIKPLNDYAVASKEKDGRKDRCKLCIAEDAKIYRQKTKEHAAKYHRERRIKNPELYRERSKRYREANKDRLREDNKRYREVNKDKNLQRLKNYRQRNPDKGREQVRRRRARKANNGVQKYTEAQVLSTYGTACHVCAIEIDLTAPRRVGRPGWENGLHIDHLIPISKGGPDTLDNARPSHAKCNLLKSAKLLTDGLGEVTDE